MRVVELKRASAAGDADGVTPDAVLRLVWQEFVRALGDMAPQIADALALKAAEGNFQAARVLIALVREMGEGRGKTEEPALAEVLLGTLRGRD